MWMENTTREFERCVSDDAFFIKPRYENRARGLSNQADRYTMLSSGRGKAETRLDKTNLAWLPTVEFLELKHFLLVTVKGIYSHKKFKSCNIFCEEIIIWKKKNDRETDPPIKTYFPG